MPRYLSALKDDNQEELSRLHKSMVTYYEGNPYHSEWVKGTNTNWKPSSHGAQLAMCERIPAQADVLEVGCGDGAGADEIISRTEEIKYVGTDLSTDFWEDQSSHRFVAASADDLPFPEASFDVVLSMFTIEHLVFPHQFLDEAWRVMRPEGRVLIVAPDFLNNPMASEKIGFSYGSGRDKLSKGRVLDALKTLWDTRVRIAWMRSKRRKRLSEGMCEFPILTEPRCLRHPGFVSDCDAVYPACPEELINYLRSKADYAEHEVFFRNASTFGLLVTKTR